MEADIRNLYRGVYIITVAACMGGSTFVMTYIGATLRCLVTRILEAVRFRKNFSNNMMAIGEPPRDSTNKKHPWTDAEQDEWRGERQPLTVFRWGRAQSDHDLARMGRDPVSGLRHREVQRRGYPRLLHVPDNVERLPEVSVALYIAMLELIVAAFYVGREWYFNEAERKRGYCNARGGPWSFPKSPKDWPAEATRVLAWVLYTVLTKEQCEAAHPSRAGGSAACPSCVTLEQQALLWNAVAGQLHFPLGSPEQDFLSRHFYGEHYR